MTVKLYHLGNNDSLKMIVFSDASLSNLPDGGTEGGTLWTVFPSLF